MTSPFLPDWVFAHAARDPGAPAVDSAETRLTYADLAERVRVLAGHLLASGVTPGARIVVALPNLPATVVAGLAVHALGGCVVEVNREWRHEDLLAVVRQTGARHAIIAGRDARTWGQVARLCPLEFWVVHGGELTAALRDALGGGTATRLLEDGRLEAAAAEPPSFAPPGRRAEDPALILYTSGSTGRPRGVVQSHKNLDANARSIVQYLELSSADRALLILPLHYCYGRSVLHTHLLAGGSLHLDNRFLYPGLVLEALGAEGCTGFAGVPTTFEIIRRQVDVARMSWPRLRYLTQAGGAMAPDTIDWVRQAFAPARLFVMYGQTEATARLSYLPPERADDKRGSIGVAIPGVELKVVDEGGAEVAPNEQGHLIARGDNVTSGYLDEPEETAAILREGWLWTGDLAWRDADGFLFHAGRSREILKIRGHRVSPVEIEHALARHPDVAEAAVVGMKQDLASETAAAFVVRRAGAAADESELRRFCSEQLPAHKVPGIITFVEALPRNAAGKLLRVEVAALLQSAPRRSERGES
jgi:acyl-coenzyme A synthetase/AMP-(fatty) acid ligase